MVSRLDFKYKFPSAKKLYERKADLICRLYALKMRMAAPRAIGVRYSFPFLEAVWPMIAQSIAEHSFMIAQIVVPLYMEFLDVFLDKNIAPERLESEALHHDDAEALTGDAATDVDGITRAMKDAAESKSIERQYQGMVCHNYMREKHDEYERKDSYLSKIVKMMDAVELVFFAQYCVCNGIGMIRKAGTKYVLEYPGGAGIIDKRAYWEIEPYFADGKREKVPISEIMYDHSLPRLEKLRQPELVNLFKLLCSRAFKFNFADYNFVNLPMDFAHLA